MHAANNDGRRAWVKSPDGSTYSLPLDAERVAVVRRVETIGKRGGLTKRFELTFAGERFNLGPRASFDAAEALLARLTQALSP